MVLTPSRMLPLGTELPPFSLSDGEQRPVSSADFAEKPLLVAFICNHCPYVKHIKTELSQLGRDLSDLGVAMVGINANDAVRYADDSPAQMVEDVRAFGYTFPYLFDAEQAVAKAFQAACTPEFYLFDGEHRLVYRGQLDDSRPGNGKPVTGRDVRAAVSAMLKGEPPLGAQTPSVGCNVKWRAGNEPSWWNA